MAISFTTQQKKDISRRQLNISTENAAYAATQASLTNTKAQLLSVDSANQVFYDFFNTQVHAYELEAQALNGVQSVEYTDGTIDPFVAGDLSTSAQTPGSVGALFFPSTMPTPYTNFVPKIVDAVNGYTNSTTNDAVYEQNLMTGLQALIAYLLSGAGSASESTVTPIAAGPITGLVLSVSSATGFAVNNIVSIVNGSDSGVYKVTAVSMAMMANTITVDSVVPVSNAITGGIISNSVPSIETSIHTNITFWQTKLNTQIAELTAQNDSRSPQSSENATALSNVNAALIPVNAWLASPDYTSGGLSPISSEITVRIAFIPTRITQIVTALGSVSQVGEVISGVAGSSYFQRYTWLNIRINRVSGSARRYFDADLGIGTLGTLAANNTQVQDQYSNYFVTKAITFIDSTPIIQVSDLASLAQGDAVTVLSETQPEIQRAIIQLMGTTQIQLDQPIPNTYTTDDKVRLYKTLG